MKLWKQMLCALMVLVGLCCGRSVALAAEPPVEVEQVTDADLDTTMAYGTRVVVAEGTRYYASADGFGSGPYGTIGNRYTPLGADIYVGGFALLNADGNLETYRGYNPGNVPIADYWQVDITEKPWERIWAELFLDPKHEYPIGWVPARSIIVLNGILGDEKSNAQFQNGVVVVPKKDSDMPELEDVDPDNLEPEVIDAVLPDPGNMIEDRVIQGQDTPDGSEEDAFISTREIAYAIEDYAENGEKVALLMDASASVSERMADIADYGEYVDKVNKAEIIIAFARRFKAIKAEEYLDVYVDSSATNIYAAINSLEDASSYNRIIIVTDTEHNIWHASVESRTGFTGKIVVVCTDGLHNIQRSTINNIEAAFDTMVYLCRLDNELDYIQTVEALQH